MRSEKTSTHQHVRHNDYGAFEHVQCIDDGPNVQDACVLLLARVLFQITTKPLSCMQVD